MGNKIVIIGAVGTALNVAEQIIDAMRNHKYPDSLLGIVIDDESLGNDINGIPVLCKTREIKTLLHDPGIKLIYALYKPDKMKERIDLLHSYTLEREYFTNFIHPRAYIAPSVKLGTGNVILSNASIETNVNLGDFNIICSNVVIEHDTVIKDNNFLAALCCIGSFVSISNGCFIGLNSTVKEHVKVGNYSFTGMGSNVLHDINESEIVFGNPARKRN